MADVSPEPPPAVAPYVEALGADRAAAFLVEFGGGPIYFAKNPTSRSRAIAIVGEDGVRALAKFRGGEASRVPVANRWLAQHYRSRDWPVNEIARTLRCSDVTVRKYLKNVAVRFDPNQLGLFDR
jgi:hypothetical protein